MASGGGSGSGSGSGGGGSGGGGGATLSSTPEGANDASELFYISSMFAKNGCYLIRPVAAPAKCLRHLKDGNAELMAMGPGTGAGVVAGDDVQWKLLPSF